MPFSGFLCEVTGEPVSPDHCLACARKGAPGCEVGSPAIIAGIIHHQRPIHYATRSAQDQRLDLDIQHGFSVTELLSCARKQRLLNDVNWYEKPSRLYYAFRGTLFHAEAERYLDSDPLAAGEERLFWFLKFSGKTIGLSGQPDLILFDSLRGGWIIHDYKTTKEVPGRTYRYVCAFTSKIIYDVPFRIKGKQVNCPWCATKHSLDEVSMEELPPQPRGSHVEQIQLYTLLLEKNAARLAAKVNARAAGQIVPENASVIGAELVYLDMSAQKRIQVSIWPKEERLELLKRRLSLHMQPELPAILTERDELWACDYCAVRTRCAQLHGSPVGKDLPVSSPIAEALEAATA